MGGFGWVFFFNQKKKKDRGKALLVQPKQKCREQKKKGSFRLNLLLWQLRIRRLNGAYDDHKRGGGLSFRYFFFIDI